ncbi:MAG: hypothetical protein FWD83_06075 [Promicromonosporaceae bacterium]|nr:hypothetical protein [Promicromonosporaceae bacterium]
MSTEIMEAPGEEQLVTAAATVSSEVARTVLVPGAGLRAGRGQRDLLAFRAEGLCPCSVEERDSEVAFQFDCDGLKLGVTVRGLARADRLRFLANAAELESLATDYEFSLSLSNLVVDGILRPQVLVRDIGSPFGGGASFREKYLALCGQVLCKGTYEDFLVGGADLFKHDRLLAELVTLGSVAAIRSRIEEAWASTTERTRATKVLVSRSRSRLARVFIPVLVVGLVAVGYFAFSAYFQGIPGQERIIEASQAYIASDFVGAQQAMAGVAVADMSFETKHFLARSYVVSMPLDDEQIGHVLMGLTRAAEEATFEFWIHLGRLEFAQALEIAQRFGETEWMLLVYIKHHAFVESDVMMPGAERQELLRSLSENIDRLRAERDRAAGVTPGDGGGW